MDDSAIKCDEIIDAGKEAKLNGKAKSNGEETKAFPANFNEKNITHKTQKLYILLIFLLIFIILVFTVI